MSGPLAFPRTRARPLRQRDGTALKAAVIVGAGILVVGTASALAWTSLRSSAERRSLPAASAATPVAAPAPAPSAAHIDLNPMLGKARAQALSWHRDAMLVAIEAAPVGAGGKIDGSGKLRFVFGKPAGARIGPGADVAPAQFSVAYEGESSDAGEQPLGRARAVAEPNCLIEDVVKIVSASAAEAGPLRLRYAMSDQHGRAVWRVQADNGQALRTLDGERCTILTDK